MPNEREQVLTFAAFARKWREDPGFRTEVETDPKSAIAAKGGKLAHTIDDIRVVEDAEDTVHFVFPPDPNGDLSDEMLDGVFAGADWQSSPTGFRPTTPRADGWQSCFGDSGIS